MPYSTYKVIKKYKDPSKGRLIGPEGEAILIDANSNNIAVVEFPNDDGVSPSVIYWMNAADLSDARIAEQAYFKIQALNTQESGLAAITTDVVLPPKAPDPPTPEQIDLEKKTTAYRVAARDGMTKFRNIPEEVQALADLKAAELAADSAVTVTALAVP